MKYFFLFFVAAAALVIGVFGVRGQKFSKPPIEVFPDMDRQDFVQGQTPSNFFHDGMGARLPVAGTVPHASDDGIFPVEFGQGRTGHYYTGAIDDYFATGLPVKELGLDGPDAAEQMQGLLRRGQDRYAIFCAVCHGESGDGKGVISRYMEGAIANLHEPRFASGEYTNGQIYHVITNGNGGLMSGYGASIPVRDRWAIVAYVRALQESKSGAPAPAEPEAATSTPEPAEDASN